MGDDPSGSVQAAPDSFRPSSRAALQNSSQKVIEELPNGFNFTNSLGKGKVPEATNTIQCCSEIRAGAEGLHTQDLEMTRLDQN